MKPILAFLLAQLYGGFSALRRCLYRRGILRVHQLPVPVVVVGNIVVGGAGKTPVVIEIVRHYQSKDIRIGVISRGYKRKESACIEVFSDSDVSSVGDEPLLIKRQTDCPLFVHANRYLAGMALLKAHPDTQLIVCDDGLTHYALFRDMEICVLDERGLCDGRLLPWGRLRERWPRKPVHRAGVGTAPQLLLVDESLTNIEGFRVKRALHDTMINAMGDMQSLMALVNDQAGCIACAGIAKPEQFFSMLRAKGIKLMRTIALPDHFSYDNSEEMQSVQGTLLCTQKDAVKLWRHKKDAWAIGLCVAIAADFFAQLDRHLLSALLWNQKQ